MALVPFPYGSYGPPPYGPGPGRGPGRLRRQAVVGLVVLVVGWLLGLTSSGRGWLTIALAWLVVLLLGAHRASGAGWLARVVAEYTVVAVLAVLLATTASVGTPPPQPTPPGHPDQGRPVVIQAVVGVRDWLAAWWRWADQQANRHSQPPSTTAAPRTGR
jgi:hypothetical protein